MGEEEGVAQGGLLPSLILYERSFIVPTKSLKVDLPLTLWEKFFRLYPGKGERSAVLRRVVAKIIEHDEDYQRLIDKIATESEGGLRNG